MKTSTNKKELKELKACASGYKVFIEAHGENDATLSQCLGSNGWDDVWWLVSNIYHQLSERQKTDLRLLGCEYALSTIANFEKEFPEDKRPRLAIEAAQSFAIGEITKEDLESARSAAESARSAAWSAARSAAEPAAWSAWSAARSAAEPAAWSVSSAESAESAESAAWSAWSAARSAARSAAWSAAESAAESAAWSANTKMLMELLVKWESAA